jgi:phage shock protein PspC (stress-responsive transcriptional regulator)
MKKTFTINLSGRVFHIEEDAYEILKKYLVNLTNYFGKDEDGKEITADIEARMAEIFSQKSTDGKNVVTLDWVNEVIETMGTPENFEEEIAEEEPLADQKRPKRKLYRHPESKVFGGVCGGIAAYFDKDPVLVRIIFVVLGLITTGAAVLAYLILWIAVPKARTTAQRLEMMGEEVTVKNIEKFLHDEMDSVKDSYNKFTKSGPYKKA